MQSRREEMAGDRGNSQTSSRADTIFAAMTTNESFDTRMNPPDADSADVDAECVGPSAATSTTPNPNPKLQLVDTVLDYIRANLENVRRTWGPNSPQYHAAGEIMHDYFVANIERLNLDDVEKKVTSNSLDDLIAKLSLDDTNSPSLKSG